MRKSGKSFNQFMSELDELLKLNTGSASYQGYDATSNLPMYIPGRPVADPMGLGGRDQQQDNFEYLQPTASQQPRQYRQLPQFDEQAPDTSDLERGWERPEPTTSGYDYNQAIQNPRMATTEQAERSRKQTGMGYGIASMEDGGVLYSDGLIRYDDGTVRQYNPQQPKAYAIASNADGSVRYSDGSSRRPATTQENQVQKLKPEAIASLEGGRVLYSDGIIREYMAPESSTPVAPQATVSQPQDESAVVNFFSVRPQGFRYNAGANDLVGECAWYSQQISDFNGQPWRVGNTIEQKKQAFANFRANGQGFRPGEDSAKLGNSIIFNEGTRWGHVATISEIFTGADGKTYYRLTESNYAAPKTVTHDRVVSANDPKIVGILKTEPKPGYTTVPYTEAPKISGERSLAVQNNAANGMQERSTEDTQEDKQEQLAPVSYDQSRAGNQAPAASMMPQRQGQVLGATAPLQSQNNMPMVAQAFMNLPKTASTAVKKSASDAGNFGADVIDQANLTGDFDLGVSEALRGDLDAAGQKIGETAQKTGGQIASGINTANLTGDFDTGISEMFQGKWDESAAKRADAANRIKERASAIPGQIMGAITPKAYASDGSNVQSEQPGLLDNIKGGLNSASQYVNRKATDLGVPGYAKQPQEFQKSGNFSGKDIYQGAKSKVSGLLDAVKTNPFIQTSLKNIDSAVKANKTKDSINTGEQSNIFQKKDPADMGSQKAIGDTSSNENAALLNIDTNLKVRPDAIRQQNDVRDPFFKQGGAEAYKEYLKDQKIDSNYQGPLDLNLFKEELFYVPEYVSSIFGNTALGKAATSKYKDFLGAQLRGGGDNPTKWYEEVIDGEKYRWEDVNPTFYENQYWKGEIAKTPEVMKSTTNDFAPELRENRDKKKDSSMNRINPFISGSVMGDLSSAVSQLFSDTKKDTVASNRFNLPTVTKMFSAAAPQASKPLSKLAQKIFKSSPITSGMASTVARLGASTLNRPTAPQPNKPKPSAPSRTSSAAKSVASVVKSAAPAARAAAPTVKKAISVAAKPVVRAAQSIAKAAPKSVQKVVKSNPIVRAITTIVNKLFRR